MLSINSAIARRRRLSACVGSGQQPHQTSHLAGAGISERPFTRPQRRFRHHCEVDVPGLRLRFHTTNRRESVPLPAPSLRSVSKPTRGEILAGSPFFRANLPRSCSLRGIHSPSGLLNPPDQSVRPVRPPEAHLAKRPIVSYSPPRFLSVSASDQRLKLAASRLTNRSVNPGTAYDHDAALRCSQTKKSIFESLSSEFSGMKFQELTFDARWIFCA
jgi:hypothetical protein